VKIPGILGRLANRLLFTSTQCSLRHEINSRWGEDTTLAKVAEMVEIASVLDIGAYEGEWTAAARQYFPDANYILVEPLPEKANDLRNQYPSARVEEAVLSSKIAQTVTFHNHETGSSIYRENVNIDIPTTERTTMTLDTLLSSGSVSPFLLKLDVQGAEIDVLEGASETLEDVAVIYAECSNVNWNEGGAFTEEVFAYLRDRGFIPFDIGTMHYWSDHLTQMDVLFFNEHHPATSEWQDELNRAAATVQERSQNKL